MMLSTYVSKLICLRCGEEYGPLYQNSAVEGRSKGVRYQCDCPSNKQSDVGTLDAVYDYTAIGQNISPATIAADPDRSIGRYAALLPIQSRASLPNVSVGNTPFISAPRLGNELGLKHLYIKDDGRNPSGSFKDRASAIAVALAQENKFPIVATASTGNAAAALAGQSAAASQTNIIFVPQTAPPAKIAQLLIYGSHVLTIDGSYDQAFDLCTAACQKFGWFNRNTGLNPYMTEGKKTVSFEIAEQLATQHTGTENALIFKSPDAVFVSVGDGCIIGGVHKGFKDLLALGWINRMPRIFGIQSEKSAALTIAWRNGEAFPQPVSATTCADSISVNAPRDPIKALNAVRQSNGAFITVTDEAILDAMLPMARLGGVFGEPAGAAALAGLQAAVVDKLVGPDEEIVVINTGNGLKDIQAAIRATGGVEPIAPSMDAVIQEVERRGLL